MPTFTTIALDTLLEPRHQKSISKPPLQQQVSPEKKIINHAYVSPALYTTPEATPLPDSQVSFTSSPYIVNHKHRGPRLVKSLSQNVFVACEQTDEGGGIQSDGEATNSVGNVFSAETGCGVQEEACSSCSNCRKHGENVLGDGLDATCYIAKPVTADVEKDGDADDFFDPQDAMSAGSSLEVDDGASIERSWKPPNTGEFYDAPEELSIDSTANCCNVEYELRELRTTLLMEIEKRKQAEEALCYMQNHWDQLAQKLSLIGLSFPASPLEDKHEQMEIDPAEELCQGVYLARAVAYTIGRGEASAEVELKMESLLEAKKFEITRLWDRLHYYEAMNHEMSLRNQETVERARQKRYQRKRKLRWLYGSIGVAVALGSAAIAWTYLQSARKPSDSNSSAIAHRNVPSTQE